MKKNVKANVLFFLRHYNDIDHMVPVIYKWLSLDKGPVDVVITTTPEYLEDYRIQFLKQFDDLKVHFINDFLSDKERDRLDHAEQIAQLPRYHPQKIARWTWKMFHEPERQPTYDDLFIERLLDQVFGDVNQGVIAFDWVLTNNLSQVDFVKKVRKAARKRDIVVVALPHGDSPYYNWMVKVDQYDYAMLDTYKSGREFDFMVVPNQLCARRYRPHMASERIKVLGSPRYNDEWLGVLEKLLPKFHREGDSKNLKVVFFLRNFLYAIFWDEVIRTIKFVTQFSDVYLVVKHHTRDMQLERLIQSYPELQPENTPNLEFVYDEVHSGSLLAWADVAMDLGTSVVFEAIKRGKPVLAMEYLHAGISTVAYYMEPCAMRCRDDLYNEIQAFLAKPDRDFYDRTTRQRFIDEVIDTPGGNVLGCYVGFLEHCLTVDAGENSDFLNDKGMEENEYG
jgi:hypothetical protein